MEDELMTALEILIAAPEGADGDALQNYLDEACGENVSLRVEVERLLAAEQENGLFMNEAPLEVIGDPDESLLSEGEGSILGPYKLLQKIGEGGFGVVYMAEQLRPVKRRVALKIIKLGMDTRQVVARFEAERQALAMMDHPGIAKVLDAGSTDTGRPYFVMELVRGTSITDYCDDNHLNKRERLELFRKVCRAVQHAHQKGVIHRDLKPSNVLVTMHDDEAIPVVIDFGVAKATQQELTDKTLFTRYEQFIGTPAYMSPEQAQMSRLDVDTRADIYALGVLLYELLTGTTPHDPEVLASAGQDEVRRVIREDEPPKPSTRVNTLAAPALTDLAKRHREAPERVGSALRGDLDWVVMKAIEKDRKRRYETANALSEDVRRFLENEPVSAAAPGVGYRLRKYIARNRAAVVTVGTIAALLVIGTVVSSMLAFEMWQAKDQAVENEGEASRQRDKAVESGELASDRELNRNLQLAEEFLGGEEPERGVALLARILRENPDHFVASNRLLSSLTQREWQHQSAPTMRSVEAPIQSAVLDSSGTKVAFTGWAGDVHVHAVDDGNAADGPGMKMDTFPAWWAGDISPDGKSLATADSKTLYVWDLETKELRWRESWNTKEPFYVVKFDQDSKWILAGGSAGEVRIFDAATGKRLGEGGKSLSMVHGAWILSGELSPDGKLVATGGKDKMVKLWLINAEEQTTRLMATLPQYASVWSVGFSRDGRRLVAGNGDGTTRIYDISDFEELSNGVQPVLVGQVLRHSGRVFHVEFSPDGSRVVTASYDGTARVWDSATGEPVTGSLPHGNWLFRARFSHDGSRVITASRDRTAKIWDVESGVMIGEPIKHTGGIVDADFHPIDSSKIMTAGRDGCVRIWEGRQGQPRSMIFRHQLARNWIFLTGEVVGELSPCGSYLLTGGMDAVARLWDTRSGRVLFTIPHYGPVMNATFSKNGKRFVTSSFSGSSEFRLWTLHGELDAEGRGLSLTSRLFNCKPSDQIRFSPDAEGRRLLITPRDQKAIWVLDSETGELLRECQHPAGLHAAAFLPPHGDFVVTGCYDGSIRMWDVRSDADPAAPALEYGRHDKSIDTIAVSDDGKFVATGGWDNHVRVWDAGDPMNPKHGNRLLWESAQSGRLIAVDFSAGKEGPLRVATSTDDGVGRVWEVASGKTIGAPILHASAVHSIRFSPDERLVVTASGDGTARVWDVESGLPISEPLRHEGLVRFAEFDGTGREILTRSGDGTARLWDLPLVKGPAPKWVPDWAEAVVGRKLRKNGTKELLDWSEFADLKRSISDLPEDDYQRWAKWFFSSQAERPISPLNESFTARDYVVARLLDGTEASLAEATRVSHTHREELNGLTRKLRENSRALITDEERLEQLAEIDLDFLLLAGKLDASRVDRLALRERRVERLRQAFRNSGQEQRVELIREFEEVLEERKALGLAEGPGAVKLFDQLADLQWHLREFDPSYEDDWFESLKMRLDLLGKIEGTTSLTFLGLLQKYVKRGREFGNWERARPVVRKLIDEFLKIPMAKRQPAARREFLRLALEVGDRRVLVIVKEIAADDGDFGKWPKLWLRAGAVLLEAGDREAAQINATRMVQKLKESTLDSELRSISRTCFSFAWSPEADLPEEALEIARLAYKLNPTQAWNGFVCGMAEYRHQNHKEAVQLLIEAISTSNERNCLRLSYLYHAMACWELGEFDEAKASFKKGKDLCDLIVKNVDRPFQHDKVYALLALEEAEELMGLK